MTGAARVAVVGGGLAGVAAALRCADAGLAVTLLESRARLGGVAGSFTRSCGGGELAVDTGQHVFLRCCTAYRDLVVRLGAEDRIMLQERLDIPVLAPGAAPARLRRTALSVLPAPLHLGAALLRYRHLPVADRVRLVRAALALGAVDRTDPAADARSFGDWLAAHGQGERAVDALWDLVGIATLNARAGDASLALAATVFQLGLLTDAAAGDIGWATAPLGAIHDEAARRALAAAGVEVRRSAKARALLQDRTRPGRWRVRVGTTDGEEGLVTDRIVCAVPPGPAERLLPAGALPLPEGWAGRLGSTPIVNVHVVYDRPVLAEGFAAGVDTPVQWVFDRTAQSGAAAVYGPRAQYLAVSLSAADDLVRVPAAALRERFLPALAALLPAARDAVVLDSFVTREPHATFRGAPGQAALRPGPRTALPGLYVAGAWTDTGWPATMEGAVRSGGSAAEALLADRAAAPVGVAA
ncbi:hydroxysqualene dehydroxylase HpnE [Pseudonocardia sp. RS010]|uniref:hydroxysqualene dehydroxylase HpnE n=1 Tax=Pseudonocardia sp. RS010 TaxID=3385979 RepID=UPI0039A11A58